MTNDKQIDEDSYQHGYEQGVADGYAEAIEASHAQYVKGLVRVLKSISQGCFPMGTSGYEDAAQKALAALPEELRG